MQGECSKMSSDQTEESKATVSSGSRKRKRSDHEDVSRFLQGIEEENLPMIEEVMNNIEEQYEKSKTFLHKASSSGKCKAVELLIKNGYNINATNMEKRTPLHLACYKGHLNVVEVLLKNGADVHMKDESGSTPLHSAAAHSDIFWRIVYENKSRKAENKLDVNELYKEARVRIMSTFKILLHHGADVNAKNNTGSTALEKMIRSKEIAKEAIAFFIQHGYNLKLVNNTGHSLLHYAIMFKNTPAIQTLIKYKSDINLKLFNGETPLHLAVKIGCVRYARILLDEGCNVNAKDNNGLTPLNNAVCHDPDIGLIELLLEKGADPNIGHGPPSNMLEVALMSKKADELTFLLLENGCDNVNFKVSYYRSSVRIVEHVLLWLIRSSHSEKDATVELLLNWGSDVNCEDKDGSSILDVAHQDEFTDVEEVIAQHCIKMRAAGFYVSEKNIKAIPETDYDTFETNFDEYKKECEDEVKKMKSTYIVNDLTFFDWIKRHPNHLAHFTKYQKVIDVFKITDYFVTFPIYGDLLEVAFTKAEKRKRLLENSEVVLGDTLKTINVPNTIIRTVLDYLTNDNLRRMTAPVP